MLDVISQYLEATSTLGGGVLICPFVHMYFFLPGLPLLGTHHPVMSACWTRNRFLQSNCHFFMAFQTTSQSSFFLCSHGT